VYQVGRLSATGQKEGQWVRLASGVTLVPCFISGLTPTARQTDPLERVAAKSTIGAQKNAICHRRLSDDRRGNDRYSLQDQECLFLRQARSCEKSRLLVLALLCSLCRSTRTVIFSACVDTVRKLQQLSQEQMFWAQVLPQPSLFVLVAHRRWID